MKKRVKVMAAIMLSGTLFSTSISPVLAETGAMAESGQLESQETTVDTLLPLETGEGFTDFKDAFGTIYGHAVWFVTTNGIAQGLTQTYFGVEEPIKRVDAAMILGNFVFMDETDVPKAAFTDVPPRAVEIVSALKHSGIVNGKSATQFGSDLKITRGEAAIMLYNGHKDIFPSTEELDDGLMFSDVSNRYKNAVHVLSAAGIIKGKTNNKFGTNEALTRGQLALLIERIYYYEGPLGQEDKADYPAEDMGISIETDKTSYTPAKDANMKITIKNSGDQHYLFTPEYEVQKLVDGKWYEVPYSNLISFPVIMGELEANSTQVNDFNLGSSIFKAPLRRGFYRIVQDFYHAEDDSKTDIAAEFSIRD